MIPEKLDAIETALNRIKVRLNKLHANKRIKQDSAIRIWQAIALISEAQSEVLTASRNIAFPTRGSEAKQHTQ